MGVSFGSPRRDPTQARPVFHPSTSQDPPEGGSRFRDEVAEAPRGGRPCSHACRRATLGRVLRARSTELDHPLPGSTRQVPSAKPPWGWLSGRSEERSRSPEAGAEAT